jgi:hypothetical protein
MKSPSPSGSVVRQREDQNTPAIGAVAESIVSSCQPAAVIRPYRDETVAVSYRRDRPDLIGEAVWADIVEAGLYDRSGRRH